MELPIVCGRVPPGALACYRFGEETRAVVLDEGKKKEVTGKRLFLPTVWSEGTSMEELARSVHLVFRDLISDQEPGGLLFAASLSWVVVSSPDSPTRIMMKAHYAPAYVVGEEAIEYLSQSSSQWGGIPDGLPRRHVPSGFHPEMDVASVLES